MIFPLSNQGFSQTDAKRQLKEVLRLGIWACAIAASCIGATVVVILHSPKSSERPADVTLAPNDPYAVLARADRLLWLMNFAAAEPLYRRAEKLFHNLGDQRNEVHAHVGELAAQTEELSRSELSRLLEKQLHTPIVQSDSKLRLWCLVTKAYVDVEYDPASAQKLWTEALETARRLKDQLWAPRAEGELGILALLLDSDRAKATRLFGQAFFATMLNGDVAGHIRLLGIMGNALNEIRRYPEALALFERAITLAHENPDIGFPFLSYEGKAEALLAQNKIAESMQILNQALALSQSQHNGTHESAVRVLIGKLEAHTGERRRGIEELERATHIAKPLDFYRMTADANFELAKLYTMEGAMSKARESLVLAVSASHRLGDLYFPPRELSALASLNAKLGRLPEADLLYGRAEDFVDERLKDVSTPYWETGFREALGDTYINHFKLATRRGDVAKAVEIIERVRGRAVTASLGINHQHSNTKTIEQQIASVQLQLMQRERTSNRSQLLEQLDLLEQRLVLTPNERAPAYPTALRNPAPLPVIQRSLRPDEELLEYVLDEPIAFCIAITTKGVTIVPLQNGKAAIEKLADTYLSRIRARESASEIGSQLYSALLSPVRLPLRSTRLIIVPDGRLHFLPFETLEDDSGDFLLRSRVVSYAPSASLLHLLRTEHRSLKPRRTLLAVGGVLYQNQAPRDSGQLVSQTWRSLKELFGSPLENLPNTKDEVLSLGKILPSNSTFLVGTEATETAFKAQPLADFKILHLAAHGIADVEFPDRAALVLGRDNDSSEDGLLQAREIMALHLNADLVTLSACDTAFGKLEGEEGISNLEEAFFIAGARTVVASLWTADDAVTSALMERFYRHIVQGDDKANALREAKLDLLGRYGDRLAPFYWAGFILSGDGASSISSSPRGRRGEF